MVKRQITYKQSEKTNLYPQIHHHSKEGTFSLNALNSCWMFDLVNIRDELPIVRHIGFLVVGSQFALDSEEKDLKIPLFLEPAAK